MPRASSSKALPRDPVRRGVAWKETRRHELLDAADRAIAEMGAGASMDDVAREAGVSRMVLYRYFVDKDGLYRALAERYVGRVMARLRDALASSEDPSARLEATIDAYVGFIAENKNAYDFLMRRAMREGAAAQATVADFMNAVALEVAEVLREEMERLGVDPRPAPVWAPGIVGMVHLATDWWLTHSEIPHDQFVDHLVGLLSHGFFGDQDPRAPASRYRDPCPASCGAR